MDQEMDSAAQRQKPRDKHYFLVLVIQINRFEVYG